MSTEEREIKLNFTMNEIILILVWSIFVCVYEIRWKTDLKHENMLNKNGKHVERK